MQCVILAGGLGTRMRPHTTSLPKSLIPAEGRPFIDYQLKWLEKNGIEQTLLLIGYKGNLIRSHIGDGRRWKMEIGFVDEGDKLHGTGGALRLALEQETLCKRFFLLYGDSFVPLNFREMDRTFKKQDMPAMMAVYRNDNEYDTSNVVMEGNRLLLYRKGKRDKGMTHIDMGVSIFERDLIGQAIPKGSKTDLADVCHSLSKDGRLAAYEQSMRFYEIGSPKGLADFEKWLIE